MKITKNTRKVCGLALLSTAAAMTIAFLVLCIKKKSVYKALLAIATVESVAGAWLLIGKLPSLSINFTPDAVELFDEDEEEHAKDIIRATLNKTPEADFAGSRRAVPLDDEATEADFS